MNIIEYAKSLFSGGVEKRDLLDEVDRLQAELTKFTIVGYKQAVAVGVNASGPNYYAKQVSRIYDSVRNKNRLRAPDVVEGVYLSLNQLQLTLPWLRHQLEAESKTKIVTENVDFKTANFMRYIDSIDFYLRYARSMLLVLTSLKASKDEANFKLDKQFLVDEAKFLVSTAEYFGYLIGVLSLPINTTEKAFDAVPTVVISEADEAVVFSVMGEQKVDPLRSGLIPMRFNVFYLVGKRRAERRVARLRQAEASANAIELTLNKLQEQKANGDTDPTLDRQIAYYINQLNKLQDLIDTIYDEAS